MAKTPAFKDLEKHWAQQAKDAQKPPQGKKQPSGKRREARQLEDRNPKDGTDL